MELRLVSNDEALAHYEVTLFDPESEWRAQAEVGAERAPELGAWSGSKIPPTWLEALAKTLLRGTAREHRAQGSWPRRLTRWRPGPEAQE